MAEYINREAIHRMMVRLTRYKWTSPVSDESHVTVDMDDVIFGIDRLPIADVVPAEELTKRDQEIKRLKAEVDRLHRENFWLTHKEAKSDDQHR